MKPINIDHWNGTCTWLFTRWRQSTETVTSLPKSWRNITGPIDEINAIKNRHGNFSIDFSSCSFKSVWKSQNHDGKCPVVSICDVINNSGLCGKNIGHVTRENLFLLFIRKEGFYMAAPCGALIGNNKETIFPPLSVDRATKWSIQTAVFTHLFQHFQPSGVFGSIPHERVATRRRRERKRLLQMSGWHTGDKERKPAVHGHQAPQKYNHWRCPRVREIHWCLGGWSNSLPFRLSLRQRQRAKLTCTITRCRVWQAQILSGCDLIRCAVLFLEHSRDVYAVIRRKDAGLPICSMLAVQPFSLLRQLMTGAVLCCSCGHVDVSWGKGGRVGLFKMRRCRHHADKIKARQMLIRRLMSNKNQRSF